MTTPFVRPDVRAFLDFLNSAPGPRMHEMDAPAARLVYIAMMDLADLPAGPLGTQRELAIPGPGGDIPATLYDPREHREPGPAMVFFHGGGFVIGTVGSHAGACAEIARVLDLPVVSVDYRLAPEAPWPAAPDDSEAATRWVAESPVELGRSVTSLVLCGDSAGGNLAIVTAMALRDRPAKVPVVAHLPFYPATDMTAQHPSLAEFGEGFLLSRDGLIWFNEAYAPDVEHVRSSPLKGSLAGLPAAVVVTASLDPLRDQGRAYAAALAEVGVPVVFREAIGNIHGFINLRQAVPSSVGDMAGALAALKDVIVEAEGQRVMAQAAAA